MMIAVLSLGISFLSIVSFLLCILFLVKLYREYQLPAHLYMLIAFSFMTMSSLTYSCSILVSSEETILFIMRIANCELMLGWIFVFYCFYSLNADHFSLFPNLLSILVGIGLLGNYYPNWTMLIVNSQYQYYYISYGIEIPLLIVPIFLSYSIYWIIPLYGYLRSNPQAYNSKSCKLQLLAIFFMLCWGVLILFTGIVEVSLLREILLDLQWLIWIFSVRSNPLILFKSKASADWVMVIHKNGLPLFSYNINSKIPIEKELAAGVLSSIGTIFTEVIASKGQMTLVSYEDKKLLFHYQQDFVVVILVSQDDELIRHGLKNFATQFEKRFKEELTAELIDYTHFSSAESLIKELVVSLLR